MIELYKSLFKREFGKLAKEIQAFELDSNLWKVEAGITNSSGNLCLHIVGNLNTYIGQKLGGTSYVRDRDFEFAGKNVPRAELLNMIAETESTVLETLNGIDANAIYPEDVLGHEMTTAYFIAHLLTHFSYHLGQINYLRRMIQGS